MRNSLNSKSESTLGVGNEFSKTNATKMVPGRKDTPGGPAARTWEKKSQKARLNLDLERIFLKGENWGLWMLVRWKPNCESNKGR